MKNQMNRIRLAGDERHPQREKKGSRKGTPAEKTLELGRN